MEDLGSQSVDRVWEVETERRSNNGSRFETRNDAMSLELTHIDKQGNSNIVNVQKESTARLAIAEGVLLSASSLALIENRQNQKGDVLQVAIANYGAKTAEIIHCVTPIPIDLFVQLRVEKETGIYICAEVQNVWKTGVKWKHWWR